MAGGTRKANRKGRSTGVDPFIMLEHWIFDCAAFRSLKPGPRALLFELIRNHNGFNNGRIGLSARRMSQAINVADRETVAGYTRELEAKGFIRATRRGGFNVKAADRRATEWALTWEKVGDALPTKDFANWRPAEIDGTENPASKGGKSVPSSGKPVRPRSAMREKPSLPVADRAPLRTENPPTYTSLAIGRVKRGGA